jgi:hypothetical protein
MKRGVPIGLLAGFGYCLVLRFVDPTEAKPMTLQEALEYRGLSPLHQELRNASQQFLVLCAQSSATRKGAGPTHGPHALAGIRTYANKIALDHVKNAEFPVGSVFVKEKFPMFDSKAKPDFITTMKKIRPGSGIDTWQFMLIDLKTKKVLEEYETAEGGGIGPENVSQGVVKVKTTTCSSCHSTYKATFGISLAGMKDLRAAQKSTGRK